jgi:hypothetical protein
MAEMEEMAATVAMVGMEAVEAVEETVEMAETAETEAMGAVEDGVDLEDKVVPAALEELGELEEPEEWVVLAELAELEALGDQALDLVAEVDGVLALALAPVHLQEAVAILVPSQMTLLVSLFQQSWHWLLLYFLSNSSSFQRFKLIIICQYSTYRKELMRLIVWQPLGMVVYKTLPTRGLENVIKSPHIYLQEKKH